MIISIGLCVLMIVANWQIMKKANEPGWVSLIPVYGTYKLYDICRANKYFWGSIIASVGPVILMMIMGATVASSFDGGSAVAAVFSVICMIAVVAAWIYTVYCLVRFNNNLAKAFGKGAGFTVGLLFLPVIFYPILAFSSTASYQKTAPKVVPAHSMKETQTIPAYVPSAESAPTAYVPSAAVGRTALLIGRGGSVIGQSFEVTSTAVLGRSSTATIHLTDGGVSGRHCQFSWRGDKLFIMDMDSSNGTAVDGYGKIPPNVPVELRSRDIIRIGRDTVFEIKI